VFCSNCGTEASGNFCWKCGASLKDVASPSPAVIQDWSEEVRYEQLVRIPEVRALIDKHLSMAQKSISGEEFLALADKVFPMGVSLEKLGAVVQPIYAQLGMKTGKEHSESFLIPPGRVIVSVLCSLARNGHIVEQVRQLEEGCLLEATLPSDIWSWKGILYVSVRKDGSETRVDGATNIKGQLFDWGKSKRCLETLFSDIRATPV
jgi:hypothetical protein